MSDIFSFLEHHHRSYVQRETVGLVLKVVKSAEFQREIKRLHGFGKADDSSEYVRGVDDAMRIFINAFMEDAKK